MNTDTYRNGCHDRKPFKTLVAVQDGWTLDGRRDMTRVYNPMAKDCQYALTEIGKMDKGCTGCKWRAVPQSAQ